MPALFVATPDSSLLSVRVTGQPSGPAVLLCDGVGCDGYIWRYLRPALERRCRVVHFHYRGHGQSEEPDDQRTLTIEQSAQDAWTVLDHLGLEKATLIGHSMGVQVILQAAHLQPERTVALVPMCGAFERPLDTFQGHDFGSRVLPFLTGAALRYQEGLRKLWQRWLPTELAYQLSVATEINAKMIRRDDFLPYLNHMARLNPLVFLAFLQSAAQHSARHCLPSLKMPALVVAGQRDNFTPGRLQHELAELLDQAELLEIPGGSHTAPLELPDLIELRMELWSRHHGLGLL